MHLGESALELKAPTLIASDDPGAVPTRRHRLRLRPIDLQPHGARSAQRLARRVSARLAETGVLVASYVPGADSAPPGWEPAYVTYSDRWIGELAAESGLELLPIDCRHPGGQRWALFSKPGFDTSWVAERPPSWNAYLDRALGPEARRSAAP